jgi:hypothetical protein
MHLQKISYLYKKYFISPRQSLPFRKLHMWTLEYCTVLFHKYQLWINCLDSHKFSVAPISFIVRRPGNPSSWNEDRVLHTINFKSTTNFCSLARKIHSPWAKRWWTCLNPKLTIQQRKRRLRFSVENSASILIRATDILMGTTVLWYRTRQLCGSNYVPGTINFHTGYLPLYIPLPLKDANLCSLVTSKSIQTTCLKAIYNFSYIRFWMCYFIESFICHGGNHIDHYLLEYGAACFRLNLPTFKQSCSLCLQSIR